MRYANLLILLYFVVDVMKNILLPSPQMNDKNERGRDGMYNAGECVFYKRPEDQKAHRCEIISYADGCCTVKGMRTATCSKRPVLTIPEQYILPVSVVRPAPKYKRAFHGSGLSVPTNESLQRKMAVSERLGMDEGSVLFSVPMQSLCRRIVKRLASFNGIHGNDNPELHELTGEFLVAALQAIRTTVYKAPESDIEDFKRFLAGEDQVYGKIILQIARTSKTAVVRFLKRRHQYHQNHTNIDAIEGRLAA